MKSVFLIAALTFALKHPLQIMQFSALIHLFIYTSICIYSFALFRRTHRTHTRAHLMNKELGKNLKCKRNVQYTYICTAHAIFSYCVYIIFYFLLRYYKRCQILNTYQWGVSFRSLHLCLPLCADKIQISICALTTHTHTHSHT